jgi:hypothetical protein
VRAPTPTDLDLAPELAILAALGTTAELARTAIISTRTELRDPDHAQHLLFSEDETGTVKTLMTLINALLEQIEIYGERIEAEHRRTSRARSNDF